MSHAFIMRRLQRLRYMQMSHSVHAAANGHPSICTTLLALGIDRTPTAKDKDGETAVCMPTPP